MTTAIRIGGPLAAKCPTCQRDPGDECHAVRGATPSRRPHAARANASPWQDAHPGDIVILNLAGRKVKVYAELLGMSGGQVAVLVCSQLHGYGLPGHVAPWQVVGIAPDCAATDAARAALARGRAS